jgi:hypothetical protein
MCLRENGVASSDKRRQVSDGSRQNSEVIDISLLKAETATIIVG